MRAISNVSGISRDYVLPVPHKKTIRLRSSHEYSDPKGIVGSLAGSKRTSIRLCVSLEGGTAGIWSTVASVWSAREQTVIHLVHEFMYTTELCATSTTHRKNSAPRR